MKIIQLQKSFLVLSLLGLSYLTVAQNIALNFDGSDDYIESKFSGITGTAARTVEAWIRTTANCDPNNGGKQKVITDWGTTATGGRFTFNVLFGNAIRIEVGGSGLNGTKAVNDGKWHHVAVVYDPKSTTPYALYLDGVLDVKGTITTSINTTSATNYLIGKRVDNTNFFDGDIDEVRVYDYAKSDSFVKLDMNKEFCSNPKGLVAYFKLNEGLANSNNSGKNKATDYTSSANHGTLNGFTLSGSSSNWISGNTLQGGDTRSNLKIFECESYTSPSKKFKWFFSGKYTDVIPNASNCDSLITIDLTIGNNTQYFKIVVCDSFISPSKKVYKTSGTYTETLKSHLNCDSIFEYEIVVNKSKVIHFKNTACDSFVSGNGKVYKSSGIYIEQFKSSKDCDSSIQYDLTINKSYVIRDTITACDSALIDNKWQYKSGLIQTNFKSISGCDSIHLSYLTIDKSFLSTINVQACDTFISPTGNKYVSDGTYNEVFKTSKGCDSTLAYQVKINQSKYSQQNLTACNAAFINGKLYETSQKVDFTLKTATGCDSNISIQLTVNKIDTSVVKSGETLTVNQNNASYQWLDCKDYSAITGATNAVFNSTYSGHFAVVINYNNCTDTSSCYFIKLLSLTKYPNQKRISILPNPNHSVFNLNFIPELNGHPFQILDVYGKLILKDNFSSSLYNYSSALVPGVYYLVYNNIGQSGTLKFVVLEN